MQLLRCMAILTQLIDNPTDHHGVQPCSYAHMLINDLHGRNGVRLLSYVYCTSTRNYDLRCPIDIDCDQQMLL